MTGRARRVWVSLNKLADSLARRGLPGDAEKTLGQYWWYREVRDCLKFCEEISNWRMLETGCSKTTDGPTKECSGPATTRGMSCGIVWKPVGRVVAAR